jgi:hypothetical protein
MDLKTHGQLVEDVRALKRLDEYIVTALENFDVEDLGRSIVEFSEMRKRVKTTLLDFSVAQIHDPAARELLSRINQNDHFEADKIVLAMNTESGRSIRLEHLEDADIDKLSSKLYEWFSHYEYIEGLYEIGSLIVGVSVPTALHSYLEEARQCYAFQQYNGMNALCRTVVEIGLKHYAERKKLLHRAAYKIGDLDAYEPGKLIGIVNTPGLREQARNLYCKMSTTLHGTKQINGEEAKSTFKEMLSVVQDLYR